MKKRTAGEALFWRGGIAFLLCIIAGLIYGAFVMEAPINTTEEGAKLFTLGIGFGYGLFGSLISITCIVALYFNDVHRKKE